MSANTLEACVLPIHPAAANQIPALISLRPSTGVWDMATQVDTGMRRSMCTYHSTFTPCSLDAWGERPQIPCACTCLRPYK